MLDALAPLPVDLDALPIDERVDAIAAAYRDWGRIKKETAWTFGACLVSIRPHYSKGSGDWGAVLDRIGIEKTRAHRYMRLARGYPDSLQLATHRSVDAALRALPPAKPEPEPTPAPAPAVLEADPAAVAVEEAVEPAPEAIVSEVFEDEQIDWTRADVRDHHLERLAIQTEHLTGDVVEHWAALRARDAQRHREDVAAVNAERREKAKLRKKDRAVCDAAFLLPPSPERDAMLARFWNKAVKAAA